MTDLIQFPSLGWVRGPYPNDPSVPVPVTDHQRMALLRAQRDADITVDGVLGPQSWVAISQGNRP